MIGSLRGQVIYKSREAVEIDISGLGYQVFLPTKELDKVKVGEDVELFTYHHLSENADDLYGFLDRESKQVFAMLISVASVGPKTALSILSIGSGERITKAIAEADVEYFKQVKGIGSKVAQRIIVDLKAAIGSVKELDLEEEGGQNEAVYQALQGLGFKRQEIRRALTDLPDEIETDNDKIKYALKQLS
jgi:Holliday junction DNA helicase RuvA